MSKVNDMTTIPQSADKSFVVEFVDKLFVVLLPRKGGVVLLIGFYTTPVCGQLLLGCGVIGLILGGFISIRLRRACS